MKKNQDNQAIQLLLIAVIKFSLQQNAYPIKCPNGSFNPHEGRKHVSECVKCTEGYYCEPEGLEKEVNYLFSCDCKFHFFLRTVEGPR